MALDEGKGRVMQTVRTLLLLTLLAGGSSLRAQENHIDLAGEWSVRLDESDQGLAAQWFAKPLATDTAATLPGTLAE